MRIFRWPILSGCVLVALVSVAIGSVWINGQQEGVQPVLDEDNSPSSLPSEASPATAPLGIQLLGLTDGSNEFPVIDHFKLARPWEPACYKEATALLRADPGCKLTTQDTAILAKNLDLDPHGWVRTLPDRGPKPKLFNAVETYLLREIEGAYPRGRYILTYDGEGTLELVFDASKNKNLSRPGREVYDVTPSNDGVLLRILQTDPRHTGNYIRNIRFFRADQENLLNRGEVFNPEFLARIRPFRLLRMMSWMKTNDGNEQVNWTDIPEMDDYSWQGAIPGHFRAAGGAPVHLLAGVANAVHADLWLNMPHQATDDYVARFAEIIHQELDPDLHVYLEYSNEVWNYGYAFPQSDWVLDRSKKRWGGDGDLDSWYGMRTAQMCGVWKSTFGKDSTRIRCIFSTQTAYKGLEDRRLNCPRYVAEGGQPCYKSMDAYAITAYFGGGIPEEKNAKKVISWLRESDGGFGKALEQIRTGKVLGLYGSLPDVVEDIRYHKRVADRYNVPLVAYEAGPDFGVDYDDPDPRLLIFAKALLKRPEMKDIFLEFLNAWKANGGTVYSKHVLIGGGVYGALDNLYQDPALSPVFQAMTEFNSTVPCWWKRCVLAR
jgi:hypothetical protein